MTTTTPDDLANVHVPAGATRVGEWDNPADPTTRRYFTGTKRVIDRTDDPYNGDIEVEVWGTRTLEGQVYRHVDVAEGGHERLTFSSAAHVRQFGEALIAAADELDQMADADLSRYSSQELVARSNAIVDELVRRLGVDETCRQLGVASIDELYRLPDPPAAG